MTRYLFAALFIIAAAPAWAQGFLGPMTGGSSGSSGSGSSISLTASTPTVIVNPSPGTSGAITIGTIAPDTVHPLSGPTANIGGQDDYNGSSITATLATLASGGTLLVTNQNATGLTIANNSQTIAGLPLSTTLHTGGFYGYTWSSSGTLSGYGFPGFGTITTNAISKFLDGTGAQTASGLTDNGTTISTAEALTFTGLSSGTVAANSYLGLNASNQVVLGAGGSGTVNSGTVGQIAVYAGTGAAVSGQTVASGAILKGQGAAVPVASAISDNGTNVLIAEGALTTPVGLTDGATIATNAALSNVFTVTIAGNRTLSNPTNLVAGQSITFQVTQDGTGSRTLAFGTAFNWLSGAAPLLNSTAAAKTTISCFADTTSTLQCAGGAPVATVTTGANCSSSAAPAVCGSASAGSVAVPTGVNPTLTVNTSAVTANSQILLNIDEGLGTKLSVTCNTTLTTLVNPVVTARSAGVSFTVQIGATLAANPACVSYLVVN